MNTTCTNSSHDDMVDQLSYISDVLLVSMQIINLFLGLPLNIYVISFLTRAGSLEGSAVFTLNHCVSEIFFALSAPLYVLCIPHINICSLQLLGFVVGIFLSAHPLFQCCVCLERYLAVVHPVTFLKFKPMRYRLAFSIVIWTCVISLSISVMLTFPNVPYTIIGVLYFLILVVELICCVSILKALRQPGPGEMRREEIRKNKMKKKAFKVILISLVIFLIESTPVGVVLNLTETMSEGVFNMAISICITVNMGARFTQVLSYIHKLSKLPFLICAKYFRQMLK